MRLDCCLRVRASAGEEASRLTKRLLSTVTSRRAVRAPPPSTLPPPLRVTAAATTTLPWPPHHPVWQVASASSSSVPELMSSCLALLSVSSILRGRPRSGGTNPWLVAASLRMCALATMCSLTGLAAAVAVLAYDALSPDLTAADDAAAPTPKPAAAPAAARVAAPAAIRGSAHAANGHGGVRAASAGNGAADPRHGPSPAAGGPADPAPPAVPALTKREKQRAKELARMNPLQRTVEAFRCLRPASGLALRAALFLAVITGLLLSRAAAGTTAAAAAAAAGGRADRAGWLRSNTPRFLEGRPAGPGLPSLTTLYALAKQLAWLLLPTRLCYDWCVGGRSSVTTPRPVRVYACTSPCPVCARRADLQARSHL
jgi:hypothetical protein